MPKRIIEKCQAPNCTRLGNFAMAFCGPCWRDWRSACILNGSWGRGDHAALLPKPEPPPSWTYENPAGEAELMDQCEQDDKQN
jgi:hypothetical protein